MNIVRTVLCLFVLSTCFGLATATSQDVEGGSQLDFHLFQNFYTQPDPSDATAAMYNAPRPVPYWVGHSNYTYQPLYPHQHLYPHRKSYYSYYAGRPAFYPDCGNHPINHGAVNKTTVVWQHGCNHMGYFPFSCGAVQRAGYGFHARRYCLDAWGNGNGCVDGGRR